MSNKKGSANKAIKDGCSLLNKRYRSVALTPFSEDTVSVFNECLLFEGELSALEEKVVNQHISKLCLSHLYMQVILHKLIMFDDPALVIEFNNENPYVTAKIGRRGNSPIIISSVFKNVSEFVQYNDTSMEVEDLDKVTSKVEGIMARVPSHILVNDAIDAMFKLHLKSASSYIAQYTSKTGMVTQITMVVKDTDGQVMEFILTLYIPVEYYKKKDKK
jgi:hypothetical protein